MFASSVAYAQINALAIAAFSLIIFALLTWWFLHMLKSVKDHWFFDKENATLRKRPKKKDSPGKREEMLALSKEADQGWTELDMKQLERYLREHGK